MRPKDGKGIFDKNIILQNDAQTHFYYRVTQIMYAYKSSELLLESSRLRS